MITVGSCFSGIGGLELGLERTRGFETKWQIEWDEYASRVLAKHWPAVKRYKDIRDVVRPESVDIICGGFPCQDVSLAGQRKGLEGKRSTLWGEMFRLICEVKPRWVVAENVPGLLSSDAGRFFGNILRDLAGAGYDAEWGVLSAQDVGANHLRERIFIVAYPQINTIYVNGAIQTPKVFGKEFWMLKSRRSNNNKTFTKEKEPKWAVHESKVGRVVNGIPHRVDRLKCLGNAVVPQVAQKVGEMILEYEKGRNIKEELM